jgi:hypothetical protein
MTHSSLLPSSDNTWCLGLTPDDLDGLPTAPQLVVTMETDVVCLEALDHEEALVQQITLSHAQMGLLMNAWIAYATPLSDRIKKREPGKPPE